MDLNRARTFVLVVENGGIAQAARKLFRTPQAVSIQIKQLEKELKFNLLQHAGPKLLLTDAGQTLYRDLKPQIAEIERSVENIRAEKQQASGMIKIGVWLAQATHYLPEIIQLFSIKFKNVGFEIKIGTNDDQVRWLSENAIDMGFVSKTPADRIHSSQMAYAQPLLPVASAEFFKKHSRPKNIRHTLSLPLIDFPNEFSAYQSWIRMNSRGDLPDARKKAPIVIVENSLIAKEFISRGLGFGFLHRELIEAELASGKLERISVREGKANTVARVKLLTKRRNSLGFVQQEFMKYVIAAKSRWVYSD